ncbi:hypothetical protein [uncultured Enorma sp.]|uniref:hypothetical protein n=1 Tax=uncultured Enorma sp. TaxID=1714346 RepID=UPI00259A3FC6|nr:hypothetical protein [uncultured Enorma sp.]
MAQKLTEQEQRTLSALTKALSKNLPVALRSASGGIASKMVRLHKETMDEDELTRILAAYGDDGSALEQLVEAGVLVAADGGYAIGELSQQLAVRGATELAGPSAQGSTDLAKPAKRPARERGTGERRARSRRGDRDAADQPAAGERHASAEQPAAEKAPAPTDQSASGAPAPDSATPRPRESNALAKAACVRKQTPELNAIRLKIIDLDPRLWINGWLLSTPSAYTAFERELRALSAAIDGEPTIGDGTLTRRELSYRIFGNEKFLAIEGEGTKLFRLMGVANLLRCKQTPKVEVVYYVPKPKKHLKLVVSENLDPWSNVRDALYLHGRKRILGKRVHGAIFGNGHLVRSASKLRDCLESLGAEQVTLRYWGDLDRAGLDLLASLVELTDGREDVTVEPFVPAYRLMLARAMKRRPNPLDNEAVDQHVPYEPGLALLRPYLADDQARYLEALLEADRLIPQEIVTAADL